MHRAFPRTVSHSNSTAPAATGIISIIRTTVRVRSATVLSRTATGVSMPTMPIQYLPITVISIIMITVPGYIIHLQFSQIVLSKITTKVFSWMPVQLLPWERVMIFPVIQRGFISGTQPIPLLPCCSRYRVMPTGSGFRTVPIPSLLPVILLPLILPMVFFLRIVPDWAHWTTSPLPIMKEMAQC